jgi:hypothetical protein
MSSETYKVGLEPCTCPDGTLVGIDPKTGRVVGTRPRLKAHCFRCSKAIQDQVRQEQEQQEAERERDEELEQLRDENERLRHRVTRIEAFLANGGPGRGHTQ